MDQPAEKYNPKEIIDNLKAHLARRDQRIAFLFGAGTSCAVKNPFSKDSKNPDPLIPDVKGLTKKCKEKILESGEPNKEAWLAIENLCGEIKKEPNIEDILTRLYFINQATGGSQLADCFAGINITELNMLEKKMRQTIASIVNIKKEHIPDKLPHHGFAQWLGKMERDYPVEIFTVNYDILIEWALEMELVPIFDGFVGSYEPFFHIDNMRHMDSVLSTNWTRLWKMHGSVTWKRKNYNAIPRVIRGVPDDCGTMIFPSYQKYDESQQHPYYVLLERLKKFLETDGAILIVIGFGFQDQHINDTIFKSLEMHPKTHVYALQYHAKESNIDLIQRAKKHDNITIVCTDVGIKEGREVTWKIVNENKIFKKSEVNIGDFEIFCNFLASITSS